MDRARIATVCGGSPHANGANRDHRFSACMRHAPRAITRVPITTPAFRAQGERTKFVLMIFSILMAIIAIYYGSSLNSSRDGMHRDKLICAMCKVFTAIVSRYLTSILLLSRIDYRYGNLFISH